LASFQKSWTWNEIARIFWELNIRKGRAYSLKACKFLEMGLEHTPKVLSPGNKLSNDRINRLASEDELA
jgi:hypothetical protein